jgi:hypothetical protein
MAVRDFVTNGFAFTHHDVQLTIAVRSDSEQAPLAVQLPQRGSDEATKFALPTFVNKRNPTTQLVLSERDRTKRTATRTFDEFNSMLRQVLGRDDLSTDNERFLRFIKNPYGW